MNSLNSNNEKKTIRPQSTQGRASAKNNRNSASRGQQNRAVFDAQQQPVWISQVSMKSNDYPEDKQTSGNSRKSKNANMIGQSSKVGAF